MSVYRYVLQSELSREFPLLEGIEFKNDWVQIRNGVIKVSKGYAWDGCSPAWRIPGTRLWLGPPDGPLGEDGRPASWRASCIHDALCQFRSEIHGLTKESSVEVFREELVRSDAPEWMIRVYPFFVQRFGPKNFLGN